MSVRVRKDGTVLCSAMHAERPGDVYIDDGLHYRLSVELRLLVTEQMHGGGGLGGHALHGQWWWRGHIDPAARIDPFYEEAA